jgi:nucleoside-diphosphate-sugar epimerase
MNNILILGSTGFLGRKLIEYLIINYNDFYIDAVYFTKPGEISHDRVNYLRCDLTSLMDVKSKLICDYDYVFNFSGYVNHSLFMNGGFNVIQNQLFSLMNVTSVISRKRLKKFIQIGSSDEYGDSNRIQLESDKEDPKTPYAFSKTASTQFLNMLNKSEKFPAVTLRLFLIYGPGQDENRFIPYIINRCIRNQSVDLTKCEQFRDFLYIDDVLAGILLVSFNSNNRSVYNLASGIGVNLKDLALKIQELAGKGHLNFGVKEYRENESMSLISNSNLFNTEFNWESKVSLEDGLKLTFDYYKAYYE